MPTAVNRGLELSGLLIPDGGGRGGSVLEQLMYAEETTGARVPNALNIIGINNIAPAIMRYGTEQQKTELLPACCAPATADAHRWWVATNNERASVDFDLHARSVPARDDGRR